MPRATTKVRTARRIPANITPKALVLAETSADSHTEDQVRNSPTKDAKARKRTTREIDARNVERSRIHRIGSCPEAASAQVALTSSPPSSSSETAPPGLPVPVNDSANSENVVALAAIKRDVLSPGGSSDSGRATRLATLARSAGYVVRQKLSVFASRDQT